MTIRMTTQAGREQATALLTDIMGPRVAAQLQSR